MYIVSWTSFIPELFHRQRKQKLLFVDCCRHVFIFESRASREIIPQLISNLYLEMDLNFNTLTDEYFIFGICKFYWILFLHDKIWWILLFLVAFISCPLLLPRFRYNYKGSIIRCSSIVRCSSTNRHWNMTLMEYLAEIVGMEQEDEHEPKQKKKEDELRVISSGSWYRRKSFRYGITFCDHFLLVI